MVIPGQSSMRLLLHKAIWKAKIGMALGISAPISLLECRVSQRIWTPQDLDPPVQIRWRILHEFGPLNKTE